MISGNREQQKKQHKIQIEHELKKQPAYWLLKNQVLVSFAQFDNVRQHFKQTLKGSLTLNKNLTNSFNFQVAYKVNLTITWPSRLAQLHSISYVTNALGRVLFILSILFSDYNPPSVLASHVAIFENTIKHRLFQYSTNLEIHLVKKRTDHEENELRIHSTHIQEHNILSSHEEMQSESVLFSKLYLYDADDFIDAIDSMRSIQLAKMDR